MKRPQPTKPDWFLTEERTYYCRRRKREVSVAAFVCEARFSAVREEVKREVQKYWKRLRKDGHSFRYLVVFEQHKDGEPHVHFLLHETGKPIRKRELERQWPHGFSKLVLVGGRSRQEARPEQAAWYVAKYLSKSRQARQLASQGYEPPARP